ncbi:nucleotide sugar dehydrogenase [Achromobacter xylosoxidans]
MLRIQDVKLAVVGLGYVGLPLAVEFGKKRSVIGFDINTRRIEALKAGHDHTLEVSDAELAEAKQLTYTADRAELGQANVFIVTVPTPIDEYKQPDLTPLVKASETIGAVLKRGDIVIYESTVYPGATEEDCVPVLERVSGLKFNVDFYAGYSPERINPGDKEHRVSTIRKVTSGSTPEVAELVDQLYKQIITAGTHKASSIRVAEAAKVIENTQRDVNIALINELAQSIGYHPEIILAGRRLNDSMGGYVVSQLVKAMTKRRIHVQGARVLVMGLAFKENCPDLRNTRIVDIVKELGDYNVDVDVYDPWVETEEAVHEYGITPVAKLEQGKYDAVILAVAHHQFKDMGAEGIRKLGKPEHILYDLKYVLSPAESDLRL